MNPLIAPTRVTHLFFALTLLLSGGFLLSSCSEDEKEKDVEVRYEVVTASTGWFGEYIVETGEKICHCSAPGLPSGWTYNFQVKEKPFVLHIDATVDGLTGEPSSPDITTNIYVDNKLVATNTSNWAKGVASADYEIR